MQLTKRGANLLKLESGDSKRSLDQMQERGSSADEINSQLMSSVSSDAFDAYFKQDYDHIGKMIKKTTKKKQVNVESASIAEYYNYFDGSSSVSPSRYSDNSNATLSLFSDS